MAEHLLLPGTLLDERYRIDSVLGEGGFGITYAAQNVRIGLKVAIKELFWRGHSVREISRSPEVCLREARDEPVFREQMERFLREARTIRDFSSLTGVAHILDYFESHGTAYIVMEYVEGETLAAHLKANGTIPAEQLFRLFLPLVESLGSIHAGGVIHRDISPDNIMVQPDGSLKLIDFGAAREWRSDGGSQYTTIAKDSYAPSEQYDKNGKQGPWTDVYALCATMYTCLTGVAPVSAVQRLFLDELKAPSQMGADVATPYEAILMRGLEMTAGKRYADMTELAQAMRAALPQPKAESGGKKGVLAGILAGVVCIVLALGAWGYHQYAAANKFRGVETEEFRLLAPADMTAAAFSEAQTLLAQNLADFAGEDNYILEVNGTELRAVLPLACFDEEQMLSSQIWQIVGAPDAGGFGNFWYEVKVNWEDPDASAISGENQVLPEEFNTQTAIFAYAWNGTLTKGQRANLIMDFKVRLDALGAPYAFGTLYGNEDIIAFRIDPQYVNGFIMKTLGWDYLYLAGAHSNFNDLMLTHSEAGEIISIVEYADGTYGLKLEIASDSYRFDELKKLAETGEDMLYMEADNNNFPYSFAKTSLTDTIETGLIEFKDFCFDGIDAVTEENRWIVDYVDALLDATDLPIGCYMWNYELLDADGNAVFYVDDIRDYYGRPGVAYKPSDAELMETLIRLTEETGYVTTISRDSGVAWVNLYFDADEDLTENIAETVPALLDEYGFGDLVLNVSVVFSCIEEQNGELCRIAVSNSWNNERQAYETVISPIFVGGDRLQPYLQQLYDWFDSVDWGSKGYVVDDWLSSTILGDDQTQE